MHIDTTSLAGVLRVTPRRHADDRGHVSETWDANTWVAGGEEYGSPRQACRFRSKPLSSLARDFGRHLELSTFTTDVESLSHRPGTLRGLHAQGGAHPTTKIVRCAAGALFDVVVDARPTSPTFGAWEGFELSAANGHQLVVPIGCLHGFITREPNTLTLYKMSAPYDPTAQVAIRWNDPDLGIDWGIPHPILSDRDAHAPRFHEVYP